MITSLRVAANRLRLALEGAVEGRLASGAGFRPSVSVGLRHDGGDGETGAGLEVGGAVRYAAARLRVEGRVRGLLAHQGEIAEWGVGGALLLAPRADGSGLSLQARSSWGEAGGGVERLWAHGVTGGTAMAEAAAASARPVFDTEAGYGVPVGAGEGVLTPYWGVAQSPGEARSYRLGLRFSQLEPGLDLGLEGKHRVPSAGEAESTVMLHTGARF